ncbi:pyruvate ferredoxin oxidoreductase [Candidatus Falkowbacteria bacterium RIFOXYB2_FULL_34_18]|uniref:Pyruvate ferredoxin oxidoreductase n=1 Tax=Candidatus Falkowbacteria bacterium RIFOXYD2_FULL_34_120 TaxID=1798007 RepID=A0A1F5TM13_9BACT|nr:MAG: pyruvate ferredoxin oxidoreductase [Candidatus Falkowbacteria bacterium RIFOXYB2_FULL_34_18]OGF29239.1 MAG: pyruvate ferredoxin oxidoreductase [Candidatus Falkowbacteria bacterium RIFOXYC12_FULL_34_55]OGF36981.1 MAG: pyruvate ferredoxin oxidoreductase [Candidatus Falkowbacteria bacterium RIFOXYC2_FULL_34_220]OGF38761.1 MAG: pyruvate ferredoxin oxidoreductase [Candidatus Falkowbacteria bacterium RIFOXYD12_FULL_34_57]OGF39995.1 MAG: pyruvate ferredoxin oxidoreductase [Candidatus Falkowbac
MHQIRIHGRGGQGVVTAAELIAIAAFNDGWQAQAFPSFGVERTGAPIEAFARIDKNSIRTREHVYEPNVLIIQDATLLSSIDVARGCDKKTIVIINSTLPKEKIKIKLPQKNIFVIDATKIALEEIGKNIVNTVILGAFAKATGLVTLKSLEKAIEQKFGEKNKSLVEKNINAIRKAYNL